GAHVDVGYRLSVVGCLLSVVGCRLSVVGCRLLSCRVVELRIVTPNDEPRTRNSHRQPTTDNRQPTTDYRHPTWSLARRLSHGDRSPRRAQRQHRAAAADGAADALIP